MFCTSGVVDDVMLHRFVQEWATQKEYTQSDCGVYSN